MKRTLVALVQDHPGVLNRVVSLIRRRNFNIDSLTVGHSETPGISRLTLVVDAAGVEQIIKQLYRLIEILKVHDVTEDAIVEREIALIKVHAPRTTRTELIALVGVYNARIVDVGASTMILEITAFPSKVEQFVEIMRPFGIKELLRTGRIAMVRGAQMQRAETEGPEAVRAQPELAAAG
ncbi:MAG: acetolactate synthase small subunit [Gemmatimonadetes bacterium]|nr:acetolactate synthase small subunit [Gemmatimonadota bacterium]